ncbi:MAG: response regulator [Hyphomicrobiales bacterium]|nr:response regulator [Hyphomicrobiales bacterium]
MSWRPRPRASNVGAVLDFLPMPGVIFILEDDEAVRDSLRLLLESRAYEVRAFATGEDFLARAELAAGDCVVLDYDLPGVDGVAVLARLRERGFAKPVVFVSGRADGDVRAAAARLDARAFFDKPVPSEALLAALAEAVGERPRPRTGPRPPVQ